MHAAPPARLPFDSGTSFDLPRGEFKEGFLRNCVQSKSIAAKEFRCLTAILAYSLLNWLRRLALPAKLTREKATTRPVARFCASTIVECRHPSLGLRRFRRRYPRAELSGRGFAKLSLEQALEFLAEQRRDGV